jgi:Rhs element Vgr protein
VKASGEAVPREHHLVSATVVKSVNRIASARLVYVDGAASAGDFPLSNAPTFLPGTEVEVSAGAGDDPATLFVGVVVKQSLKVRDHTAPQLVIECRHKAVRLTVGRRSAYYFDQTDGDVIESLLGDAGLDADVARTTVTHAQQVQYACTDWDYLLARAEANGLVVLTNGAGVAVKAPALGAAATTLQFGATVLEMDAELDARDQYAAVQSATWDAAQQSVVTRDATDPGLAGPGNVASADLADVVGLPHLPLATAAIGEDEAQAWADAAWLKSRLAKATGRLKCEGIGTIDPGDAVTLAGLGDRFNGDVVVTGVRHDFDLVQGWKTHVQFGGTAPWFADERRVSAPAAGALLPAVGGLQIGVVVGNEDPGGEHRVRVRMPLVSPGADGTWARVAAPDAGDDRGFFFRPEIGDEVVLGFLDDDPRQAVVLGMLHSSAKPAPLAGSDDNHEKGYQSRAKMKLYLNDEKKVIKLETPAGNTITLSEDEKAVTIADQNGNSIAMTTDGITIESAKALTLKAGTEVKLESGTAFSAKGGTELKLEGTSGAELSSTAVTKVKGSLLQLN